MSDQADWRETMIARVCDWIGEADAEIAETVKWRKPSNGMAGIPVWEKAGLLCTAETYTAYVKRTFAKGALPDPSGIFNASLEGGTRRAIDIRETDVIDVEAFKAIVRSAVALNLSA